MNMRDTLSSTKYNPKIKLTKQIPQPARRFQTQANQYCVILKSNQYNPIPSHRIQAKKQIQKNKYLEVYSKLQTKQTNPRKTFKVHTNRPFILNKHIKTQADEHLFVMNQTNQMHRRKMTQATDTKNVESTSITIKYEIDGVAGKGTFGTVYYGHVRSTGKKIAIKKVLQDKRYKNRQLQIIKTLKHPNLLEMKDYFMTQEDDKEYLNVVMDYFPENLYQWIKKKPMNPFLIKIYIYQILRGLMFMSFRDIAHRDMKPHNVLINSQTNKVVICDFGSAKQLVKEQPNLAYICSRCYRAPQLIFGATDYTSQIDIWSTGCILVQMINGEPPFLGDSQIDQLIEIIKIMGTPSKDQILEMNHEYNLKDYSKFPSVKKTNWRNILKTKDPLLVDLVNSLLQYSPERRFTAEQALKHKYFDDLRQQQSYKQLFQKIKAIPQLFDYIPQELEKIKNPSLLMPKWVDTNHTSHLSTSNLKNIDNLTANNLNIQITKSGKLSAGRGLGTNTKTTINFMGTGYTVNNGLLNKKVTIQPTMKKQC